MSRFTRPARRLATVIIAIGVTLAGVVGLPAASGAQPGSAKAGPVSPAATTFQIQAGNSGKCLSPAYGFLGDGFPVVQQPCDGSTVQRWYTAPAAPGTVQLVNAANNKCVDLTGWAPGSVAMMLPCYDENPKWIITPAGNYATLRPAAFPNLCLDLANASVEDGAPAWLWYCNETSAQQWHLV